MCLFEGNVATIGYDAKQPQPILIVSGVKDGKAVFEAKVEDTLTTIEGIAFEKSTRNIIYICRSESNEMKQ